MTNLIFKSLLLRSVCIVDMRNYRWRRIPKIIFTFRPDGLENASSRNRRPLMAHISLIGCLSYVQRLWHLFLLIADLVPLGGQSKDFSLGFNTNIRLK